MLSATTELEAINIMLAAIGADPVNEIDEDNDVDVANARKILTKISSTTQMPGWDFNTLTLTFNPDLSDDNSILWDDTLLKWKTTDGSTIAKRGGKMFSITNNSFSFPNPIQLQVVQAVDYEDLPEPIREYVAIKAAYDFQAIFMGDTNISKDLQVNLAMAQSDLVSYDMNMGDYNMLQVTGVSANLARR